MATPTAEVTSRWSLAPSWRRLVVAFESYPIERIGFAAIAAGIVLRFVAPFFMDLRSDGDTYTAMGHAWAMRHEFLMPYGDVSTWEPRDPEYSNHYPPAYPFYLGLVFSAFGFGLWQAKWAAVAVSLAAVLVVYLTSRDLYGRKLGALAAGLVALEPHLLWSTGAGFSENMVLLFFALTMWAIVKSLKDDRYIVLAGLFAALTYLSRASVGYFFVIAGTGGFFWRLAFRGWSVLANKWYLGAIALFGGIAALWAYRNVYHFGFHAETVPLVDILRLATAASLGLGFAFTLPFLLRARTRTVLNLAPGVLLLVGGALVGAFLLLSSFEGTWFAAIVARGVPLDIPLWETSSYTRYVQEFAIERPDLWRKALLLKIPFFLAFGVWYVVPFLPESWKAVKKMRDEETSALWLSVILVWLTAWAIAGMFWVFEQSPMYWLDNHRYVVIGLLPLVWLLLRESRPERASFRIRYVVMLASLFVACAATILSPVKFSDLHAAEHMDQYLQKGDEVAVDGGTIKYAFYAYLTHPEEIKIYGWGTEGYQPEFVLTLNNNTQFGDEYTWVGVFRQTFWNGGVMSADLYARDDVVADRAIQTGIVRNN